MAAVPVYDYDPIGDDPDDPAAILRLMPREHHEQFLSEYRAALAAARDVDHYRDLHSLLRRWRLLAEAMSRPGFTEAIQHVRDASQSGNLDGTLTLDEVISARTQLG
jgi:hypothetical protein